MGCPTEVNLEDNLVFSITTHDPDTGVVTDAASAPTYRVYENEGATALLSGTMNEMVDADSSANTTGFYTASIACTAVNGFEHGKTYTVYIEATVDGDKGAICYSFKAVNLTTLLQAMADEILKRGASNVEATADEFSLCYVILALSNAVIAEGIQTVKKTDDTTFATKNLTTDAAADPITGIS